MTATDDEIKERAQAAAALLDALRTELIAMNVFRDAGSENDLEGARQGAASAIDGLKVYLKWFEGLCQ